MCLSFLRRSPEGIRTNGYWSSRPGDDARFPERWKSYPSSLTRARVRRHVRLSTPLAWCSAAHLASPKRSVNCLDRGPGCDRGRFCEQAPEAVAEPAPLRRRCRRRSSPDATGRACRRRGSTRSEPFRAAALAPSLVLRVWRGRDRQETLWRKLFAGRLVPLVQWRLRGLRCSAVRAAVRTTAQVVRDFAHRCIPTWP
jgi:hypothetical protein